MIKKTAYKVTSVGELIGREVSEQLKIQLYKAFYQASKHKALIKKIKQIEKTVSSGLSKKYSLYNMTLEHIAETIKEEFLVAISKDKKNTDTQLSLILPDINNKIIKHLIPNSSDFKNHCADYLSNIRGS